MAGAIFGAAAWQRSHRPRIDLSPARVAVRFTPVRIGPIAPPARVVGAWTVSADDGRFGGVSGLAIDRGRLLALSDAGMLLWLDWPETAPAMATIRALPAVAGTPTRKIGRDSEAIARDPRGRGWWVAFEQVHSVLLYDAGFTRLIERKPIVGRDFVRNAGVEALVADRAGLRWLSEASGASDATVLADGRLVIIERRWGATGFRARLIGAGAAIELPLAWSDNPEAITAEPRANGATRLWIMTDNDLKAWRRTLLVAIDLPPPTAAR